MNPVLLILVLPLVDLLVLIWIGRHTSWQFALGLAIAGGVAGLLLLKHISRQALRSMRADAADGRAALAAAGRSVSLLAAAILLMVPGVLSDLLAVLLMIPLGRKLAAVWLLTRLRGRVQVRGFAAFDEREAPGTAGDHIIDVQVVEGAPDTLGGPQAKDRHNMQGDI